MSVSSATLGIILKENLENSIPTLLLGIEIDDCVSVYVGIQFVVLGNFVQPLSCAKMEYEQAFVVEEGLHILKNSCL